MGKKQIIEMINDKNHDVYVYPELVEEYRAKGYMVIGLECNAVVDAKGKKTAVPLPTASFPTAQAAPAPADAEEIPEAPEVAEEEDDTEELIMRAKECTVSELQELVDELELDITLSNYSKKAEKVAAVIDVLQN